MADVELVVRIPEEQYRTLNAKSQSDVVTVIDDTLLINAIKDGTVLPKGHERLIAEPTEEEIAKTIGGQNDFAECIRDAVKAVFGNAHTIIEADKEIEK